MGGPVRALPLEPDQRGTLERWARGRRTSYRLVVRARIVLRAAEGLTNRRIARELSVSPLTVALWRSRFILLGLDGISRDAPRLGSRRPLNDETLRRILVTTLLQPSPSGRRWSSRTLAREVGVSHSTVLRVWRSHRVRAYRTPIAALAHDPRFQPRAVAVSGIYVSPPHGAIVLSDRASGTGPSRGPSSVRESRPSGNRTARPAELVRLLARLETSRRAAPASEQRRKDFLAFLGSATDRSARGGESHLMVAPSGNPMRSTVVAWTSRSRAVRLIPADADVPLHQLVDRWLAETSRNPRTQIVLDELPQLERAVDRWTNESALKPRPFVWVSARTGASESGADGPPVRRHS
jgi:transposase-like protein